MAEAQPPQPSLIVIFGASGDLTKRKLIPALYSLHTQDQMPENFAVLGISRTEFSDDQFREQLYEFAEDEYEKDTWRDFAQHVHYHAGDATQGEDWPDITKAIERLQEEHDTGQNVLFYLSTGPKLFEPIVRQIGESGLVTEGRRYCSIGETRPWQRVVVEKPFGHDLKSARQLNEAIAAVFEEEEIYRIDHYLGKELVANLLVVRFANTIFEPLWNRQYIDHVQITASESVGVEGRGGYYDGPAGGAMRDMIQTHLLQVLSFMAMEPPVSTEAADIRSEKIKVFKALRVPKRDEVPDIAVRGQYGPGELDGEKAPGYREEEGTDPDSATDTYAAMQFHVDTWRWGGVPFYLRSGKRMPTKLTEIVLYFKPTPHVLFMEEARKMRPNQIVINVQPNEGIRLRFEGKVPGMGMRIDDVVMDFDYVRQWQAEPTDGYAILLSEVLRGDQTLFKHRDEIEISWKAVQPVLEYWDQNPPKDFPNYPAGTWGPEAADVMMREHGRYWRNG